MMKFWNWVKNDSGSRTLRFDGVIASEDWYGDEITPEQFRSELFSAEGDVTVWINSPGGCCFAASVIYSMLAEYKGNIIIKVDGCAFSAASVIAMAGDKVMMSPTALMMIHNPWTVAIGESNDMKKAANVLDEVKESIINAYHIKTGLNRNEISSLMDEETFMSAQKAIDLGFADGIIENTKKSSKSASAAAANFSFSQKEFSKSSFNKVAACFQNSKTTESPQNIQSQGITAESLNKRLSLLK